MVESKHDDYGSGLGILYRIHVGLSVCAQRHRDLPAESFGWSLVVTVLDLEEVQNLPAAAALTKSYLPSYAPLHEYPTSVLSVRNLITIGVIGVSRVIIDEDSGTNAMSRTI